MLKAHGPDGLPLMAWNARRGGDFTCPECHAALVLRAGERVIHHFAHYPGADCPLSVGESLRHMEMKRQMGAILSHFQRGRVEYEVRLSPEHRADVVAYPDWVPFPWDGHGFVVECQASALSVDEWDMRTRDYNALGFPILWVWDAARLGLPERFQFRDQARAEWPYEARIPQEIRWCHDTAGGGAYALDCFGQIRSASLVRPPPRFNEYQDGWYVPKTKKTLVLHATWLEPEPYTGRQQRRLVHLGEMEAWDGTE